MTAAAAILDFQKPSIRCRGQICAILPNFIKIDRTVAEIWRLNGFFFQNGGRPTSWICWVATGTTDDDHLMVSIVLLNLVKIDAVVSIT